VTDPAAPAVRAVVIDDSAFQCSALRHLLEQRYGARVTVETYVDPVVALERLTPSIGLLLLDWEMPALDGGAMLEEARRRGVDLKRVIIRSGHQADELHRQFDGRGCLCVIEKGEQEQQEAFLMILDGIVRRSERAAVAPGAGECPATSDRP
jgi:CheY-like chemotaxis protein